MPKAPTRQMPARSERIAHPIQAARRRIHPQAVPRGLLRFYLLFMLTRSPETGYSIMTTIEEKTEGAWRPGPGTIYPLLKDLEAEGLIEHAPPAKGDKGSITYSVTAKGRASAAEIQRVMLSAGKREHVMMMLFADILPPEDTASLFVRRQRDMFEVFKQVSARIPGPQRDPILAELSAVLQAHVAWLNSQKGAWNAGAGTRRSKR